MNRLAQALRDFVGASDALGGGRPRPTVRRKELIARLEQYSGDLKRLAIIWTGMLVLTFAVILAGIVRQIVNPYVAVPLGGAALVSMLWRVERVWRERERLWIALQIALHEEDDGALRDLMIRLRDAALGVPAGAPRRDERSQPPVAAQPVTEPLGGVAAVNHQEAREERS